MDAALRVCIHCRKAPRRSAHPNTKYCTACQEALLRRPASRVTPAQAAQIEALRNTMTRDALAKQLGVPRSRVQRYLREHGLRSNVRDYPADVVEAVAAVYEAAPKNQGKRRVQEQFPDVVARSVIERRQQRRPTFTPRQQCWTGEQRIEAARMAGLVSPTAQARYFGRPNAYAGSIRALWVKRFRCAPHDINGLPASLVWPIVTAGTPAVLVRHPDTPGPRAHILWIDLADHLRPDVGELLRQAIATLAAFQRWLHQTTTTAAIHTLIQEREHSWRSAQAVSTPMANPRR